MSLMENGSGGQAMRSEVVRALTLLRRAATIMDALADESATGLVPDRDWLTCQRIEEASHAIHLALIAATECVEDPDGQLTP